MRSAASPRWLFMISATQLATICAGTEMLVGPDLTRANVKRLAGNIHKASLRMRELVSDLIGFVHDDPSVVPN